MTYPQITMVFLIVLASIFYFKRNIKEDMTTSEIMTIFMFVIIRTSVFVTVLWWGGFWK